MESANSSSADPLIAENLPLSGTSEDKANYEKWFSERFESLLPSIQERWPDVALQTLEATCGSLDEVVRVIVQQSSIANSSGVREQLEEILNVAGDRTKDIADSLEPLEKQLEELLDELNGTLRPKLETPVRNRPLLAVGIAAGFGLLMGLLLSGGGRRP